MRHFSKSSPLKVEDMFRKMDRQHYNDIEAAKSGRLKFDNVRWDAISGCTSLHKVINF